jgi:hypothetical protein
MPVQHNGRVYPCVESMTKLRIGIFDVRVWRDESEVKEYDNSDLIKLEKLLSGMGKPDSNEHDLAVEIANMPSVSAVEVTWEGNGIVLYTQW